VVGISGGIDSAAVATLSVKALGRKRVIGLLLFENKDRNSTDFKDAREVISRLGITSYDISFSDIIRSFKKTLRNYNLSRTALGNIKARARMTIDYAVANSRNLLVAGTGDKSEELIGYFTKYGDGGVDFQPIAHLYKTEVKKLALHLGIPSRIVSKPSSPHLWKGHLATDEIPLDYPILDEVLRLLFDQCRDPNEVSKILKIPRRIVAKVTKMHEGSGHKRRAPPMLRNSSNAIY
jgi:NAD+ synthase